MKIDISIQPFTLHFNDPFQIAYEKVTTAEIVIIQLTDRRGLAGLGTAAPDTAVTGETVQTISSLLTQKLNSSFFSFPLDQWYRYHQKIQSEFADNPSAQNAVEEALLNLFCAQKELSLTNIFGGYRQKCKTMVTLGIKDVQPTLAELSLRRKEGFDLFKLKCGLNLKDDIAKIEQVTRQLKNGEKLIIDANQGYTLPDAISLLTAIKNLPVAFIEQPLPQKDIKGLQNLRSISPHLIIAD